MALWLKPSVTNQLTIGPFVATDFLSIQTNLSVGASEILLSLNGSAMTVAAGTGLLPVGEGHYRFTAIPSDVHTAGRLRLSVRKTGSMPLWQDFVIAAPYDQQVSLAGGVSGGFVFGDAQNAVKVQWGTSTGQLFVPTGGLVGADLRAVVSNSLSAVRWNRMLDGTGGEVLYLGGLWVHGNSSSSLLMARNLGGHAAELFGGVDQYGLNIQGGPSGGVGMFVSGGGLNAAGFRIRGAGTAPGLYSENVSGTGPGARFYGAVGHGVEMLGSQSDLGVGAGLYLQSARSGSGGAPGLRIEGDGGAPGVYIFGQLANSPGIQIFGGPSGGNGIEVYHGGFASPILIIGAGTSGAIYVNNPSGPAFHAQSRTGNAVVFKSLGGNGDGLTLVENGSGKGLRSTEIQAIQAKTDNLPSAFKKNTARAAFMFLMVDSSGVVMTGLTITAERSIDAAAFAACANSASEVGSGVYAIDFATSDLNGNNIMFKFSGTAAATRYIEVITIP